jgi:hypothetical protein
MALVRVEERLERAVPRLALGDDLERRERNLVREGSAQLLRERRHLLVRRRAPRRPLPHLTRAICRLAVRRERAVQEDEVHEVKVASSR